MLPEGIAMIEFREIEKSERTEEMVVVMTVPVRHLAWLRSCVLRGAIAERDQKRPLVAAFDGFSDDMGVVFDQTYDALASQDA